MTSINTELFSADVWNHVQIVLKYKQVSPLLSPTDQERRLENKPAVSSYRKN